VKEVCDWVEHLGLGQYRKRFLHHCIGGPLLLQLTDAHLKVWETLRTLSLAEFRLPFTYFPCKLQNYIFLIVLGTDTLPLAQMDLAIPSLGHRRGLLMAIQDLRGHQPVSSPQSNWNGRTSAAGNTSPAEPSPVSNLPHKLPAPGQRGHCQTWQPLYAACLHKHPASWQEKQDLKITVSKVFGHAGLSVHPSRSLQSHVNEMSVKTDRGYCWVQVATISREDSRTLANPFAIEHQRGLWLRHLDKARARAALRLAYVPSCPPASSLYIALPLMHGCGHTFVCTP
jgi:hypothetical protein